MKDIISKDPRVEELMKERDVLERQLRSLRGKISTRIEKILLSKLRFAVAQHKWRIVPNDNYSREDPLTREITLELIDDDHMASNGLPSLAKVAKVTSPRNRSKYHQNKILSKKMIHRNVSSDIKNYRDFVSFSERYEIDYIIYKNTFLNFSYNRIRIASKYSMDDVYSILRKFEFPLDLSVQISDIEKIESDLRKRKELMHDLSSKSLFSL
jgi:hypothetical protein